MSDSSQPHGLQPTRLLQIFQARVPEWGAIAFSVNQSGLVNFKCPRASYTWLIATILDNTPIRSSFKAKMSRHTHLLPPLLEFMSVTIFHLNQSQEEILLKSPKAEMKQ